jgi:hypothetical protein
VVGLQYSRGLPKLGSAKHQYHEAICSWATTGPLAPHLIKMLRILPEDRTTATEVLGTWNDETTDTPNGGAEIPDETEELLTLILEDENCPTLRVRSRTAIHDQHLSLQPAKRPKRNTKGVRSTVCL